MSLPQPRRSQSVCTSSAWVMGIVFFVVATFAVCVAAQLSAPVVPLQSVANSSTPAAAMPLLTPYWSVAASFTGVHAMLRYNRGSNLATLASDFYFPAVNITTLVMATNASSFAALAWNTIYCFNSNATNVWLSGTFVANSPETFDLYTAFTSPALPLVIGDVLVVGTQNLRGTGASVTLVVISMTTGMFKWTATIDGTQYANFVHLYDPSVGIIVQTSTRGSDSTTYVYSLNGDALDVKLVSTDSPGYNGIILNSTHMAMVAFSVTVFAFNFPNATMKATFSSLGCVGLKDVGQAPTAVRNGIVYSVCLYHLYAINLNSGAVVAVMDERNNQTLSFGAVFNATSPTTMSLYYGTTQGRLYKVNFATNTITQVFADPDTGLFYPSTYLYTYGLQAITTYNPPLSSTNRTPATATPLMVLATRASTFMTTVRGFNPLTSQIEWQITSEETGLYRKALCDGVHLLFSSDLAGISGYGYRIIQQHTFEALIGVNQAVSHATSPSATSLPYFVQSPPNPASPLGVALDVDTNIVFVVVSSGLNRLSPVSGGAQPGFTLLCSNGVSITKLQSPPVWVVKRYIANYTNVTVNTTFGVNVTVTQNMTNTTLQNVTLGNGTVVLQNVTSNYTINVTQQVNATNQSWYLVANVVATKALCYLDTASTLRCYNTSSQQCSGAVTFCDGRNGSTDNSLSPVSDGDGRVMVFCTGSGATAGAMMYDVVLGQTTSFGSTSTNGAVGAWDRDAVYVPHELTGSVSRDARRYRIVKYRWNSSSAPLWSTTLNVALASNVALAVTRATDNTTLPTVHAISTSVSSTTPPLRSFRLITLNASNGAALNNATGKFPGVQLSNTRESQLFLSVAADDPTSPRSSWGYVFSNSFFAVINCSWPPASPSASLSAVSASTVLYKDSVWFSSGPLDPLRAAPVVDTESGVAIMYSNSYVLTFNLFNGSVLWRHPTNVTALRAQKPLLAVVNKTTVVFSTSSGVAAVDYRTGTCYFESTFLLSNTAVNQSASNVYMGAVSMPKLGIASAATFAGAVSYTSEGIFASPFAVVVPSIPFATPNGSYVPLRLRSTSYSARVSPSISISLPVSLSQRISPSKTMTKEKSETGTPANTLTLNPLQSRTRRLTHTYPLSRTATHSSSDQPTNTRSQSKPLKKPTKSGSDEMTSTMTIERLSSSRLLTATPKLSQTKLTYTATVTTNASPTGKPPTRTHTLQLTGTLVESLSHGSTTVTATMPFTETPIYIPPPTPQPTPAPTPVPPNLAAPPEEASYAWIAAPSVSFIVLIIVVVGAVLVSQKRKRIKAAEALKRQQRGLEEGDDQPSEMVSYRPPLLDQEADALEARER